MKNKDAIEKAIEVLKVYASGKETSLTKIAAHEALQALTQAQEKPIFDVEGLIDALENKDLLNDLYVSARHLFTKYRATKVTQTITPHDNIDYWLIVSFINILAEQGYIGAPVVPEAKQCQSYDDMIIEKLRQAQDDFDNSVDLIETAINMINAGKQG